jgi:threonine synthase
LEIAFSDDELIKIIRKAYTHFGHIERAPLVELRNNHFLLELFHGPTLAFKDFAMQAYRSIFQVALEA